MTLKVVYRNSARVSYARSLLKYIWTHPSNRHKQIPALLRSARFQMRGRILHRRTLAQLGNNSYIWAILRRGVSAKVIYANPPDHAEMLAWRRTLKPGDLFVDVGANVGTYAIWAAELGADVIALEPAEDTYELLAENVSLNGYGITAIRAAAGATSGTTMLSTGRDDRNCRVQIGGVETALVTIDSIVGDRTIAGMKVDVEGFEIDVLHGCERALSDQRIKLIQLEWNDTSMAAVGSDRRPVAELLAAHGYRLYRPTSEGLLTPIDDLDFGADVFALPETEPVP
jgi:FkbM family methyltransferase